MFQILFEANTYEKLVSSCHSKGRLADAWSRVNTLNKPLKYAQKKIKGYK